MWACVRVISETVATLPFHVFERRKDGRGVELAPQHHVYRRIHDQPNEEMTNVEFWETILSHALLYGNGFARIEWDGEVNPRGMYILHPDRVEVKRDRETGVKFYSSHQTDGGERLTIFDDDMLHIPGLGYDGMVGYSPVHLHRRTIELGMAAGDYMLNYLKNNARPGMYISHPGRLGDTAQKNLRESWSAVHAGLQNAGKPGVLEEGMKIETVGSPAKDMEFLAMRKYQTEEIARIYRVPLHLIQSMERATFSNIEHQSIDFAMHTIRPWCKRIEARVNRTLLGPREGRTFFAEFAIDGLMRGDYASRIAGHAQAITSGQLTPNEARALENRNAIEGGDDLYMQGAMMPLSMIGQVQQVQERP